MSSRSRVVHMASNACGETLSMRPRHQRAFGALRAEKASTNSHGFTSAVRATISSTSCSLTGSLPRCATALFFSSLSGATVLSPTWATSARAAPSVMVNPCVTAMERTVRGSSLRLMGEQSITALFPCLATALYRRVFLASFVATSASTVVGEGSPR